MRPIQFVFKLNISYLLKLDSDLVFSETDQTKEKNRIFH